MTFCFIGIGSNKNPEYHCQKMIEVLRQRFGRIWVSSLKKTAAHGVEAEDYINGVVCFEADIKHTELKTWCRELEDSLGRVRGGASCVADLDILFLADSVPSVSSKFSGIDSYYQEQLSQMVNMLTIEKR